MAGRKPCAPSLRPHQAYRILLLVSLLGAVVSAGKRDFACVRGGWEHGEGWVGVRASGSYWWSCAPSLLDTVTSDKLLDSASVSYIIHQKNVQLFRITQGVGLTAEYRIL